MLRYHTPLHIYITHCLSYFINLSITNTHAKSMSDCWTLFPTYHHSQTIFLITYLEHFFYYYYIISHIYNIRNIKIYCYQELSIIWPGSSIHLSYFIHIYRISFLYFLFLYSSKQYSWIPVNIEFEFWDSFPYFLLITLFACLALFIISLVDFYNWVPFSRIILILSI